MAKKYATNYQRIINMKEKELAQFLCVNISCTRCPQYDKCNLLGTSGTGWYQYLNEPLAETEDNKYNGD